MLNDLLRYAKITSVDELLPLWKEQDKRNKYSKEVSLDNTFNQGLVRRKGDKS